jgi:hypothetical protein
MIYTLLSCLILRDMGKVNASQTAAGGSNRLAVQSKHSMPSSVLFVAPTATFADCIPITKYTHGLHCSNSMIILKSLHSRARLTVFPKSLRFDRSASSPKFVMDIQRRGFDTMETIRAMCNGVFLGSALCTLLGSSVHEVFAFDIQQESIPVVKGNTNKRIIQEKVQAFNEILNDLDDSFVDPVDIGKLAETGFNAMLNSLDPYTEFETPKAAKELRTQTSGNYGGVGLVVGRVERGKGDVDPFPYVLKSLEGFAFDYGVRVGVRISRMTA